MRTACSLAVLVCFLTFSVHAQQAWVAQTGRSGVTLEVVKSFFGSECRGYKEGKDYSAFSADYYLGGVYVIQPGLSVAAELPIAAFSATVVSKDGTREYPLSKTVVCSPLIAAGYGIPSTPVSVSVATRIPIIKGTYPEDETFALNAGRYADFERKDAFVPGAMPLMMGVSYKATLEGMPHSLKLMAGTKYVFSTDQQKTTNAQVFSAIADVNFAPVTFRAGYMVYTSEYEYHLQDLWGVACALHLGRYTAGIAGRFLSGKILPYYAHSTLNLNITYRFEE